MASGFAQRRLELRGVETRVLSALEIRQVAEAFLRRRALRHLERALAEAERAGNQRLSVVPWYEMGAVAWARRRRAWS